MSDDTHDHDDEGHSEQVTAADLAELRDGFAELREALDELREASTARERQDARADVRDAQESLDDTAKRLGVSRKQLEASIADAKRAERKEELVPIVRELFDELRAAADDEPEPKPRRKPKPKPREGGASADHDDAPATNGDSEPIVPHFTERRLSELLR